MRAAKYAETPTRGLSVHTCRPLYLSSVTTFGQPSALCGLLRLLYALLRRTG
jgi:hypothetical protein